MGGRRGFFSFKINIIAKNSGSSNLLECHLAVYERLFNRFLVYNRFIIVD